MKTIVKNQILFTILLILPTCFYFSGCSESGEKQSPYHKYSILPAGEVKPMGWIREQLIIDLQEGVTGNMEIISDNVNGNLFVNQNRVPGTLVKGNRERDEKAWWAGEHEGYWKDAIIRAAFLLDDKYWVDRSHQWVTDILAAEKEHGYIGIYTKESRFPDKGFDGELWTQSRMFQGLLAYYEFTGNEEVLHAIERTVQKTINHYRKSTYFGRPEPDGGVQHGIGYMDTLEWLYRLTGNPYYKEAAIWLYEDFNNNSYFEDLRTVNLLDRNYHWMLHAPKIMEGVHMPIVISAFTGEQKYKTAADRILELYDYHCNPGGGVVGISRGLRVESVNGMMGSGDLASEYCTIMQGVSSFNRFFSFTGDLSIGNRIERTCINAAQGSRFHPANKAVIYMSHDNCLRADDESSRREVFSASHTAAICCPLNSGRLMPYYIEGMWYKKNDGKTLLNKLYGPSWVNTSINGRKVKITADTQYPFSDKITYKINAERPLEFNLELRIPPGSVNPEITTSNNSEIHMDDERILISGKWRDGDMVNVDFNFQVQQVLQNDQKQAFYLWGPMIFSLKFSENIKTTEEIVTNRGLPSGFFDYSISPVDTTGWRFNVKRNEKFYLHIKGEVDNKYPWVAPPLVLKGNLYKADHTPVEVELVPLGSTILRRTTFPVMDI